MLTSPTGRAGTVHREKTECIHLGDWFICETQKNGRLLVCVTEIGSNYVHLYGLSLDVEGHGGHFSWRQHRNELHELLPVQNWQELIAGRVTRYQEKSAEIMQQVQDITRRLGVRPQNTMIGETEGADTSGGTALAVLSAEDDISKYALDLKAAKEDNLPTLFKRMKFVQERMADWMQMPLIPLRGQMSTLESVMEPLKERVFQVGLYAGLTEQAEQIAEGVPAAYHDKLHVFQLRRYMDEECLLDYNAGGIDIHGIHAFDAWLAKPENRDRILPLPRCMVAMRVRRVVKDRDWEGSLRQLGINIELEQMDKLTFLFVRNGENLYRINTEIDFPEWIFPDSGDFMGGEPLMFRTFADRVDDFITVRAYESMMAENAAFEAKKQAWEAANPISEWAAAHPEETDGESQGRVQWLWENANPYCWHSKPHSDLHRYEPLTPDSIHYDDAMRKINDQQKEFNRIALVIQGLLDRSTALHPHPPVNLATQEGFEQMIVLVRDGSMVLTHGEKPDFEAYRRRLNALITPDSFFVGQDTAWALAEAEKETRRMDTNWRNPPRGDWRPKYHRPYGNPGPSLVSQAKQVRFKKGVATKATFAWERERAYNHYSDDRSPVPVKLTVPVGDLLNVSAYQKGDFKIFFADPRTRAEYLRWAPLLLTAEKWWQEHSG
ncbi:hypothetical protein [Acidithiobacillus ferrooxidans]|uniref:hypothetical protein n=1 Tax=Acidithiobacillus ferrooxidans TaxID=920 RepID=UPI000AFA6925|nr:hypothetical protein [Acidithiobacillus ferrooxidans]